jgi:hypothetical protein
MLFQIVSSKVFTKSAKSFLFICHLFIVHNGVLFSLGRVLKKAIFWYDKRMKTKINTFVAALSLITLFFTLESRSQVDDSESDSDGHESYSNYIGKDDDLQSYESIVKDLQRPLQAKSRAAVRIQSNDDSFSNTTIHAGVGYATMFETIDADSGRIYANQSGVQVAVGIDLFSEHLSAEGSLSSFGEQDYTHALVAIKEFDLMFYGKQKFAPNLTGKIGGGIAGRYLTLTERGIPVQYSTPSSVITTGMDLFLADAFSIGGEIAMRNAMIGETIDQRSYTMLVRLDTHF